MFLSVESLSDLNKKVRSKYLCHQVRDKTFSIIARVSPNDAVATICIEGNFFSWSGPPSPAQPTPSPSPAQPSPPHLSYFESREKDTPLTLDFLWSSPLFWPQKKVFNLCRWLPGDLCPLLGVFVTVVTLGSIAGIIILKFYSLILAVVCTNGVILVCSSRHVEVSVSVAYV